MTKQAYRYDPRAFGARAPPTRNSSGDEIANVNFLYDDSVHAQKENTIDSCINSATYRFLQRWFTKFSEIAQ